MPAQDSPAPTKPRLAASTGDWLTARASRSVLLRRNRRCMLTGGARSQAGVRVIFASLRLDRSRQVPAVHPLQLGQHCLVRRVWNVAPPWHPDRAELRHARCALNSQPWKVNRSRPQSRKPRSQSRRHRCQRRLAAHLVRNRRATVIGNTKVAAPIFKSRPRDPVRCFCPAAAPPVASPQTTRWSARPARR